MSPSHSPPRPGRPTQDLGIVDGLVQASFAVQAVLADVTAEHDLSIVQLRLLGIMRDREPRMAQLAQLLGLTRSSTTGLIDRAQRRGLVQRVTRPTGDGRAVRVVLTDGGRELIDSLGVEVDGRLRGLAEDLSETGRQRLSRLLTRVVIHDAQLRGIDLTPDRPTMIPRTHGVSPAGVPGPVDVAPAGTRVAVIIGSTRPNRICPGIAAWVMNALQADSALSYELIDLSEIDLPFLDEPLRAALAIYEHEHTRAWSRLVSSYGGFVFVFPQYNWGYPAPLKNALDFLYREWRDKPATSVTYGTRGGNRGAQQINQVFNGLHMRPLTDSLEVVITDEDVDEAWQLTDLPALMRPYLEQVRGLDEQMTGALRDGSGVEKPPAGA